MRTCAVWIFAVALAPMVMGQDWHIWSPRPELAPKSSMASGEMVLEGGGNAAVFGGWERTMPGVKPGRWYRMRVSYQATGLTYEPSQILARIDWVNAGKRAGQPDYASHVETAGEWRTITLDAPAPEHASAVNVQLLLLNAPQAVVRWKDATLEPVDAPAPRKVTISTIRLRPSGPDPVARFIELIESSVPPRTDVILLPEGMARIGTGKSYFDTAEPLPGPTTRRLGDVAKKRHAWIVAGIFELEGGVAYNTSVLIDREGRLAGKYRKVYLPREEIEGGLTAGSEFPVFQTDFGKVGMMICWDVQFADVARALALRGAELILMPIAGGSETLAAARTIENRVFLVSSGYDFPSMILDPNGKTIARSEADGTVATATIDLTARYLDPWLGDMHGRFLREVRANLPVDPTGRK